MSIRRESMRQESLQSPILLKEDSFHFKSFNEAAKRHTKSQVKILGFPSLEKQESFSSSIDVVYRKQKRLVERFRQNETKYTDALSRMASELAEIKRKTSFIKVANGQSVAEYLKLRHINENRENERRENCLQLLNLAKGAQYSHGQFAFGGFGSNNRQIEPRTKMGEFNRRGIVNQLPSNMLQMVFSKTREANHRTKV